MYNRRVKQKLEYLEFRGSRNIAGVAICRSIHRPTMEISGEQSGTQDTF